MEKLPTPESHVYSENGAEIMVYNMKRHSEKKGAKKKKKERWNKYKKEKGKTLND